MTNLLPLSGLKVKPEVLKRLFQRLILWGSLTTIFALPSYGQNENISLQWNGEEWGELSISKLISSSGYEYFIFSVKYNKQSFIDGARFSLELDNGKFLKTRKSKTPLLSTPNVGGDFMGNVHFHFSKSKLIPSLENRKIIGIHFLDYRVDEWEKHKLTEDESQWILDKISSL